MATGTLFDQHQELLRAAFESALPFDEFLVTGQPQHRDRWQKYVDAIQISPIQEELIKGFARQMNILVMAGLWCGDCARQCPMLHKFAQLNDKIKLRFIDNETNPALRDELRIHGASRVPVVVTLSEDYLEIERFGDKTLSAYRRKAARELGAACDSGIGLPPVEELAEEVAEWLAIVERQQLLLRVSPMLRKRHND